MLESSKEKYVCKYYNIKFLYILKIVYFSFLNYSGLSKKILIVMEVYRK